MLQKRYILTRGPYLQNSSWLRSAQTDVAMPPPAGHSLKHIFSRFSLTHNPIADGKESKISVIQSLMWSSTSLFSGLISWQSLYRHFVPLPSVSSEFSASSVSSPAFTQRTKLGENQCSWGVLGQNPSRKKAQRYGVPQHPHYVGHWVLTATWQRAWVHT